MIIEERSAAIDSLSAPGGSAGPGARTDSPLPVLELRDLFKIYREGELETVALRGAWLTVAAGDFIAIAGSASAIMLTA